MVTLRILLLFHFVAAFECIHILHALYNFTEHRMLSVQMRSRLVAYIELASARVAAGMRHGQASTLMLVRVDFAVDGIARTAGSRSLWATALSNEPRNYAVKYKTVIKPEFANFSKLATVFGASFSNRSSTTSLPFSNVIFAF